MPMCSMGTLSTRPGRKSLGDLPPFGSAMGGSKSSTGPRNDGGNTPPSVLPCFHVRALCDLWEPRVLRDMRIGLPRDHDLGLAVDPLRRHDLFCE